MLQLEPMHGRGSDNFAPSRARYVTSADRARAARGESRVRFFAGLSSGGSLRIVRLRFLRHAVWSSLAILARCRNSRELGSVLSLVVVGVGLWLRCCALCFTRMGAIVPQDAGLGGARALVSEAATAASSCAFSTESDHIRVSMGRLIGCRMMSRRAATNSTSGCPRPAIKFRAAKF